MPRVPARQVSGGQGDKCEYVQMKGDQHMLEDNCMRGGMSCERKCDYDTSEPVCEEELTVSRDLDKDDSRLRNLDFCLFITLSLLLGCV